MLKLEIFNLAFSVLTELAWLHGIFSGLKAHFHRLLEPQHWISTLTFDLNFQFQHWQNSSMLKWNFNVDKIGSILSAQHWSSTSTLKWIVNVEIECWGSICLWKWALLSALKIAVSCESRLRAPSQCCKKLLVVLKKNSC